MVKFFNEGFFGYSKEIDFKLGSLEHIIPILLTIVTIILIRKYRKEIKEWKWEERFRYIFAFLMIIVEMSYFWRILYVGNDTGATTLLTKLPIQICQWGLIICTFMMMSKNQNLFGINYYLTPIFSIIAMIYPRVIMYTGPKYYRYYQFWLEHILPLIGTFYMMYVHQLRPKYKHIYYTLLVLIPLAILSLYANSRIDKAVFLYLDTKIPLIPDNQYIKLAIMSIIVIILFHIMYFISKKIKKIS